MTLQGTDLCADYTMKLFLKRLLVETSLTFEKALKIAVVMETATKDAVELRGKTKAESSVNSIREAQVQHRCYQRGKEGHDPQTVGKGTYKTTGTYIFRVHVFG